MVALHSSCLILQTSDGQRIPCEAEQIIRELIGGNDIDEKVVHEVAAAVVLYFRDELGRETISVSEFSHALIKVLTKMGYKIISPFRQSAVNPIFAQWFWIIYKLSFCA